MKKIETTTLDVYSEEEILSVLSDIKRICQKRYPSDWAEIYSDTEYKFLMALSKGKIDKEKGNMFSYAHRCVLSAAADLGKRCQRAYKEEDIDTMYEDSQCSLYYSDSIEEYEKCLLALTCVIKETISNLYEELKGYEHILDVILNKKTKKDKARHIDINMIDEYENTICSIISQNLSSRLGVDVSVEHIKQYFKDLSKEGLGKWI